MVPSSFLAFLFKFWQFFHNSLENIVQKFSVKVLRLKLEEFLRPHLAAINFDEVDLMTTLDGRSSTVHSLFNV